MLIRGVESMNEEAARFVGALAPHAHATVVALSGDLGSGKTAFVKAAAAALGVKTHVTSPTFVIMKMYPLHERVFKRLVHIDAYRLKGEQQLRVLGWDEILSDPSTIVFIEWPEHAGGAIPQSALRITLRYSGEHEREIRYENSE